MYLQRSSQSQRIFCRQQELLSEAVPPIQGLRDFFHATEIVSGEAVKETAIVLVNTTVKYCVTFMIILHH